MVSWLDRTVAACCQPSDRYVDFSNGEDGVLGGEDYPLLWYRDLEKHSCGEFSFAIVQANQVCEDYGHVEPGREGTLLGFMTAMVASMLQDMPVITLAGI